MAETPGAGGGGKKPPKKGKTGTVIDLGPSGVYVGSGKKKGQLSEKGTFIAFIKAHPALNQHGIPGEIWKWTSATGGYGGITATELAAVLWAESGGRPDALSSKGALGIAQIFDVQANAQSADGTPFFRTNLHISDADKRNVAFSIRYAAWRLSGYRGKYGGSIDEVWKGGYNPGYKGRSDYISQYLPKGYAPTPGRTIPEAAGTAATTQAVAQGMTDPYVVGVKGNGELTVKYGAVQPKNTIMYDGAPMHASSWAQLSRSLEQYFVSYTGGRPNNKYIAEYIKRGWSPYSLTKALAGNKNFKNSPIYKKKYSSYEEAAKDILPPGQKLNDKFVKSAIVNDWDANQVAAVLRRQPGYVKSNEFKQNSTTLMNVHTSIMGNPTPEDRNSVNQATLAGWSTDQYAAYLRGTDAYVESPEYQMKTMSFLTALGMITGTRPGMVKGTVDPSQNPNLKTGKLPYDPRAPKAGIEQPAEDTKWVL